MGILPHLKPRPLETYPTITVEQSVGDEGKQGTPQIVSSFQTIVYSLYLMRFVHVFDVFCLVAISCVNLGHFIINIFSNFISSFLVGN